jgi:hypothetical protein
MNETRETANAAMHQAIPGLVADIASGRVKKIKSTMLLQANRPSGLAPGRNQRHRVTPVLKKSTTRKDKRSG